jgi:hypothetical protein
LALVTAPTPTVTAYFDLSAGDFFVLDDPVKGELNNSTYLLSGDVATDVTSFVSSVSITRGRSRALDEFSPGTASVVFRNELRTFDPTYEFSQFYGNIKPGKRLTIAAGGVTIFDGKIRDWNYSYEVGGPSVAVVEVVDALGQLGAIEFDDWTTTSQTPALRFTAVLDRPEVVFGANRDFDDGVETLQADVVSWGSNVLNYLQLVARSDHGRLFASREGVLTYRDRLSVDSSDFVVTFTDDGGDVPFTGIALEYGSEFLYNRVGVDREGGTLQTVEDADSIADYGVSTLSLSGLLLNTDAQSESLAEYLLGIYKEPELRVSEVSVALHDSEDRISDALKLDVLALDIGDVVRVWYTPNKEGSPLVRYGFVEGLRHDLAPAYHSVTVALSDAGSRSFFIFDDDIFGEFDGVGVFAF